MNILLILNISEHFGLIMTAKINGFHNGLSNGQNGEVNIGCDLKQTEQEIFGISDYYVY